MLSLRHGLKRREDLPRLYLYQFLSDRRRNRVAMFFQTFQIKRDGILDIGEGIAACRAVCDAAWEARDCGDKNAVLVRFY